MVRAGESLTAEELAGRFADVAPPLGGDEARFEAARCLDCFDAPCTRACPTSIDVPRFLRQILHRDESGAARTILDANIYGGSCARACPTEVLCEGACVAALVASAPIPIGRLQRFACDSGPIRFEPGPSTGRRVAVVGSGPAGLSCAHDLRRLGHDVIVFEGRDRPGGLATQGIAAYKVTTEFAMSEVEMIRAIGIEIRTGVTIDGAGVRALLGEYDAVFLGVGLGHAPPLEIDGEDLAGVVDAIDFVSQTHQRTLADCVVGRDVVVIGAGNTAIDAATAARRLGADRVTIAYRKGEASMSAFAYEYDLAKSDGVRFEWFASPARILGDGSGTVAGVEFHSETRPGFVLPCDQVVKAHGHAPLLGLIRSLPDLAHDRGQILVDPDTGATSILGLFAGGDCLRRGGEIVEAVRDGKIAARGIDRQLARSPARGADHA